MAMVTNCAAMVTNCAAMVMNGTVMVMDIMNIQGQVQNIFCTNILVDDYKVLRDFLSATSSMKVKI